MPAHETKAAGVPGRSVFATQFETKDRRRAPRARRAHPPRREFVIISIQRSRPQQRASRCCASP
ncbi:protein of unknown function [Burkholderia multivorans]